MRTYDGELEVGSLYEDYVYTVLYRHGLCTAPFRSKGMQYTYGENLARMEVKCQLDHKEYGSLCIEEYALNQDKSGWHKSSIFHDINLFITGDLKDIYYMTAPSVRAVKPKCKVYETPTSRGYRLPVDLAEQIAWHLKPLQAEIDGPGKLVIDAAIRTRK